MRRFEELNREYIAQNMRLVRHPGSVRAAAGSADRPDVPGRAVGGRPPGAARPHLARQLRHVQHLHGHAGLADDRARLGGEPDAARHAPRSSRINEILREKPSIAAPPRSRPACARSAARSSSEDVSVDYPAGRGAGRQSICAFRPARRSRSWAIPARARARWSA